MLLWYAIAQRFYGFVVLAQSWSQKEGRQAWNGIAPGSLCFPVKISSFLQNVGITCTRFTRDQLVSKGELIGHGELPLHNKGNLITCSGHFGKVYLSEIVIGEDVDGNQRKVKVACKELKPEFARDAFDEAKVMASIRWGFAFLIEQLLDFRHLHVVSMLGYLDDGPVPVLVSEYMEGGCLLDYLKMMRGMNVGTSRSFSLSFFYFSRSMLAH